MNERDLRFPVGAVVLVAVIITGILIFFFAEGESFFRNRYSLQLGFAEAPGVTKDTPVRKNGILIGRASSVELLEEGGVKVTVKIDQKYRLRKNEVCRISTSSLLGDAVLEFVSSGKQDGSKDYYKDGDFLKNGIVTGNPLEVLINLEDDLRGATLSIKGAGDDVSKAAQNFNKMFAENGQQIERLMQKSEIAIDQFGQTMESINGIVGDEEMKKQLKKSLDDLPEMLNEIRQTFAATRQTLSKIDQVTMRADSNLKNLEEFTKPLGENGDQLAENIGNSLKNLDELLAQLSQFSKALNDRKGSVGKLVYDKELYDRLNRAADNVEHVSRRLGPIIDDVRIFTDKIARDPRQLGVKGAIDRRPSGTGFKPSLPWRKDGIR